MWGECALLSGVGWGSAGSLSPVRELGPQGSSALDRSASHVGTTHNISELIIQPKHYGLFTFLLLNIQLLKDLLFPIPSSPPPLKYKGFQQAVTTPWLTLADSTGSKSFSWRNIAFWDRLSILCSNDSLVLFHSHPLLSSLRELILTVKWKTIWGKCLKGLSTEKYKIEAKRKRWDSL